MKSHFSLLLLFCVALIGCGRSEQTATKPDKIQDEPLKIQDAVLPRFKLYKTENYWNLLLLDTQTGRLWQAQYSVGNDNERHLTPISTEVLASGQDGRFSLTPTVNMWTFILTDNKDGRLWQCQFGMKSKERFCIPIEPSPALE